jgi:transcriptional regulator with XRE-family HTH domain
MDEKLRILMQNENLTASKLSEILEVKPAAVSHILSGRNKPSFELLCKIVTRFPHINPYWLLGDAEEMLNPNATNSMAPGQIATSGTLFDQQPSSSAQCVNSNIRESLAEQPSLSLNRTDIEKIIIVYRDQTFEEIRPKR